MKYLKLSVLTLLLAVQVNAQAEQHKFLLIQTGPEVTRAVHLIYMDRGYDCLQEAFITRCFNTVAKKFIEVTVIGRDGTTSLTTGFIKTNIKDYNAEMATIMSKTMNLPLEGDQK